MLKTKDLTEKICMNLRLDESFAEIEEELETNLWELHDQMKNQKNS